MNIYKKIKGSGNFLEYTRGEYHNGIYPIFLRPLIIILVSAIFLFASAPHLYAWDGNYLVVDGVNDYAELTTEGTVDVAYNGSLSFTVDFWVYATDYGCIIGDDAYDFGIQQVEGSDALAFKLWLNGSAITMYNYTNIYNDWHHIVLMFDNLNNRAAIGVDGNISWYDNIDDDDGLYNGVWPLVIGSFTSSDGFLDGKIDEVRISNSLRYSGDTYSVPTAPHTTDSNTLALWHFDDPPGSTSFSDSSGNGNTLSGYNGATTEGTVTIAAEPAFTPPTGVYDSPCDVTITCTTGGAVIRYTTDGTEPTEGSTQYTGPINITETITLKARAFKSGLDPSDTVTGTYTIESLDETTLYMRFGDILSEEIGDPTGGLTWHVGPAAMNQWQTHLEGDITGTFYYSLNVTDSASTAVLHIEFIVEHDGDQTTAAEEYLDVGIIQSGHYTAFSGFVYGLDLQPQDGDTLILKISHVQGTQSVGIFYNGSENYNDSYVKIYYRGPVACFTVEPEQGQDRMFNVDASCSFDSTYSTEELQVRWDWENDGNYDTAFSFGKTAAHEYLTRGTKNIKVQVKTPAGMTRTRVNTVAIDMVVLESFLSPGPAPLGLTWDGEYLWLADASDDKIYKMTLDGEVVDEFDSPGGMPMELAWDGEYLWIIDPVGNGENNQLYKVDTDGTLMATFDLPTDSDIHSGLTWDGFFLWAADPGNNRIYKINPDTGGIEDSFSSPCPEPYGMAYDGQYFWIADDSDEHIYKVDLSGNIINKFESPGNIARGLAWDGSNLWVVNLENYTIYQLTDRIPTTITCELSSSDIILGESLTVSGQIDPYPDEAGKGVSIKIIPPSGEAIYGATLADITGQFDYSPETGVIDRAGTWTFQTSWAGDDPLEGSFSENRALTVSKAGSRVTLDITSHAIKIGDTVSVSGKFTPQPDSGADLSGIPIDLDITGPGDFSDTLTVYTNDEFGHFSIQDYDAFNSLGEWTLQAVFSEDDSYLSSSSDSLSITVVEAAGYAIIVQGKHSSGEGIESHNKTANFVYEIFKNRGLLDEDIMYLNYDTNQEGVDAAPDRDAVEDAVTIWARDMMDPAYDNPDTGPEDEVTGKPANLYIVMVDHGLEDLFYIFPETITASDLEGWLDTLQGSLTGQAADQEIVVILGFCRSGSFIDNLSENNRVIISSSAPDESSYKGPLDEDGIREGEYFISEFFKGVSMGKSIKTCFENAVELTEVFTSAGIGRSTNAPHFDNSRQHPLLDDNGDGTGTNDLSGQYDDGLLSDDLIIGVSSVTGNDPGDVSITRLAPSIFLDEYTSSTDDLWARVDDNSRLKTIWVEVKPPGYDPDDPEDSGQVVMDLSKTLYTTYNSGEDQYEWSGLGGFDDPGTYQVFYFAQDDITDNVSPLVEGYVYKNNTGNNPAGSFDLLEPYDDDETSTVFPVMWENSIDPDGDTVTYTLEISENGDFSVILYKVEGIADNYYFVGEQADLQDLSSYYWRVTAVDCYGAQTVSEAQTIHTNNTNGIPGYLFGTVINSLGQGIVGASVTAGSTSTVTHDNGTYTAPVPSGTYTVTVSADGYDTLIQSGVIITAQSHANRDFVLTPTDSDNDGTPDSEDGCPEDSNKTEPGICGCGVADTDSDGDETLDCNDGCPDDFYKTDPGQCGCGVLDTDSDDDGTADCNDECPEDPLKVEPGVCGCGEEDTDSEPDGMIDCWEIDNNLDPEIDDADDDADGDGFSNIQEYKRDTDPQDAESHPSRGMPWLMLLLEE